MISSLEVLLYPHIQRVFFFFSFLFFFLFFSLGGGMIVKELCHFFFFFFFLFSFFSFFSFFLFVSPGCGRECGSGSGRVGPLAD